MPRVCSYLTVNCFASSTVYRSAARTSKGRTPQAELPRFCGHGAKQLRCLRDRWFSTPHTSSEGPPSLNRRCTRQPQEAVQEEPHLLLLVSPVSCELDRTRPRAVPIAAHQITQALSSHRCRAVPRELRPHSCAGCAGAVLSEWGDRGVKKRRVRHQVRHFLITRQAMENLREQLSQRGSHISCRIRSIKTRSFARTL